MEERHIEAEYDAWVSRIQQQQTDLENRFKHVLDQLLAVDSQHNFDAIMRKYNLAQVIIYLQYGLNTDEENVVEYLKEVVK